MAKLSRRLRCMLAYGLGGICMTAHAASDAQLERGELLYSTHCNACHTEQVHWRDRGLVTDMSSLSAQVRRWQSVSRAGWGERDIEAVTQYLNLLFYHFPEDRQREGSTH